MTIARKPKSKPQSSADIDAVINKGGSVAKVTRKKAKVSAVVVRIPSSMLQQLDRTLKAQPIKKPRHMWILEAIAEKLERESD